MIDEIFPPLSLSHSELDSINLQTFNARRSFIIADEAIKRRTMNF
jgi:hypothetical protein